MVPQEFIERVSRQTEVLRELQKMVRTYSAFDMASALRLALAEEYGWDWVDSVFKPIWPSNPVRKEKR